MSCSAALREREASLALVAWPTACWRLAHDYRLLVVPEPLVRFWASQASTVAWANWRIRSPYAW
jgi:hypothetical protein